MLYLAYSKDGLNFKVLEKPFVEQNTYRSCFFPMHTDNENIDFGAIIIINPVYLSIENFSLIRKAGCVSY
jgi:hypothetical protein